MNPDTIMTGIDTSNPANSPVFMTFPVMKQPKKNAIVGMTIRLPTKDQMKPRSLYMIAMIAFVKMNGRKSPMTNEICLSRTISLSTVELIDTDGVLINFKLLEPVFEGRLVFSFPHWIISITVRLSSLACLNARSRVFLSSSKLSFDPSFFLQMHLNIYNHFIIILDF